MRALDDLAGRFEAWFYPAGAGVHWYRGGTVHKGSKTAKLAALLAAAYVCALPAVNDALVAGARLTLLPLLLRTPWWAGPLLFPLCVGATTCALYHCHALALDARAAALWATPAGRARTKAQPRRDISPALRASAVRRGNLNAFLTGVAGSGLLVLHVRVRPWAARADAESNGFGAFLADAAIAYAWIDFSAYWLHRALHAHAGVYAALHRSHHVYQVPCAHAAFASHPADFLVFQLLGMAVLAFVRLHPLAFAFAAVPTAYHNQIEHSGLLLTGEMPWAPTPAFHDDHHAQYTCNFGFETTLWDWAFGTLRRTKGKYGEDAHEQAR